MRNKIGVDENAKRENGPLRLSLIILLFHADLLRQRGITPAEPAKQAKILQ